MTWYGKTAAISAAAFTCPWPSVFGTRAVTVVLIRDRSQTGYDLVLVTTGTAAIAAQLIERCATRWPIEVAIQDVGQVFGAGQARSRTARAVARTVPFQLACQVITTLWYATAGHDPADVADHRARALVHDQGPALDRRRGRQAPPRHHRRHLAPTSRHPKKSASSAWPGRTQRHDRDS
jgi:hypothetical protein